MRPKLSLIFLVAIAITAAACTAASTSQSAPPGTIGGGSSGGGGTSVSDPCSLLTPAEISAVVGQTVGAGSSASDSHQCSWQYPTDGVPTIQVSIGMEDGSLESFCGVPSSSGLGISIVQVSGVGDGACFTEMAGLGAGSNLAFAKGGQVFTTAVVLGPNATSSEIQAADKALALDALPRI